MSLARWMEIFPIIHNYVHVHVHTSARVALIIISSLFAVYMYLFRVVVSSLKPIQFMLWCAMLDHLFCGSSPCSMCMLQY